LEGVEAAHPCLSPTLLSSGLIFYDTKVMVMNRVLNVTVQRTADHAAPEITLDPLEIVGGRVACEPAQTKLPEGILPALYILRPPAASVLVPWGLRVWLPALEWSQAL
jgi:hypothetical protein